MGKHFPDAELEWLIATTFNHAVDYYTRGEQGLCHRWAFKAMDLAAYVDDGEALRNTMQSKVAKLRLDGTFRG